MALTRLEEAIKAGNIDAVRLELVYQPQLAAQRTEDGISLVLLALYHGHPAIAELLAALKRDLDVFEAAALDAVPRLQHLLDLDPTLAHAVSSDGFTALHLAAYYGHTEAVRLLLARHADPNALSKNTLAVRPLHSALAGNSAQCVRLLVDAGANVEAAQPGRISPAHQAAAQGNLDALQILAQSGANLKPLDEQGRTPRELALQAGHQHIVTWLDEHALE